MGDRWLKWMGLMMGVWLLTPVHMALGAEAIGFLSEKFATLHAVKALPGGDSLVAGRFSRSAVLGDAAIQPDAGKHILARIRGEKVVWIRQTAAPVMSIGVGGDAIFVGGQIRESVGLLGCELTLANELAAYVAKLDGNGRCTWSRVLQEEDDVTFTDLAVDPTGAVVVAGSFDTRLKIGSRTLTGSMRKHVFVAKFRADGTLAWADAATGGNSGITGIYGQALALGPEGQVVFTGSITGTADFGSVRLKTRDAVFPGEGSIPMHGVFLVGYGAEGGMLSARIVAHGAQVEALSVGSDGAVVMSGMFKGISGLEREAGRAYFGTQASLETTHRTQGGQTEDTWVGRFSSVTGGLDWVLQGKSTGDARSTHLVVLGDGRIAVLGMARRGMTWVGSEHRMPEHPTAPTEPDVFLSLLSSSGKVLRTWTIGGTGSDYPNGLAAGGGQVWATGSFKDRVQFGSARLESRAAGKSNGFLWRVPVGE